ncbi:MAG: aminoacyl-histidine dipeptidase [Prevotellaceae bacterium]|jgi:dipeptidase D|nr:aminoacyl-histidine dipeptidase [Prevotellaceae bacterium]
MEILAGFQPEIVFKYFEEISKIPRPSGKEEKIIQYLLQFAEKYSLEYKKDDVGNVLITKPASKGKENCETLVLQAHVDMIIDKNEGVEHDFENDAISMYVENGWIKARGTTLGADCGIGVAAALAALTDNNLKHCKLECLFTVDEERELLGAKCLPANFFTGKTLVNLDSEDEGELFIGCAGGINSTATFSYNIEPTPSEYIGFKVAIGGLIGGHSGDDINKGRANAVKVLDRFLWRMSHKFDFRISHYEGGNKSNAIPREAYAILTVHKGLKTALMASFDVFKDDIEEEFGKVETKVFVSLTEVEQPAYVIDELTQFEVLATLHACPTGVLRMSDEMPNLVETSMNIASIKFDDKTIVITTSQRSSIDSKKFYAVDIFKSLFSLTNACVKVSDGYPGWKPNFNSPILQTTKSIYEKLFNQSPLIRVVHAGLECGLFLEKYPNIDMISIGPTIKDAHSPDERLEIASVVKFWALLKGVIETHC